MVVVSRVQLGGNAGEQRGIVRVECSGGISGFMGAVSYRQ